MSDGGDDDDEEEERKGGRGVLLRENKVWPVIIFLFRTVST
jgi:hypothetical protein